MLLHKNVTDEIDIADPWARDQLNRKQVADYLTPVLASINQPFVIGLHSSYGTGKTFFVDCWRQDLKNKGFKTAYFNAWETDFSQDALSAFISALKKEFVPEKEDGTYADKLESFVELTKKAGGFMSRKAMPLAIKALGRKYFGEEGLEELINGAGLESDEVADFLSGCAVESLKTQELSEDAMNSFKVFLRDLVRNLIEEESVIEEGRWENVEQTKKLIIFVDELDRCRPTYAVEVLECIKHLFAVENVVFVLSIDDEQIKNAIAAVYGNNLDAEGYLRRFIDWRFRLPDPDPEQYAEYLWYKYSSYAREKNSSFQNIDINGESTQIYFFGLFSKLYNLSLREQEQVFTSIFTILANNSGFGLEKMNCLFAFSPLYEKSLPMFEAALIDETGLENFLEDFKLRSMDEYFDNFLSFDKTEALIHSWFLNSRTIQKIKEKVSIHIRNENALNEKNIAESIGQAKKEKEKREYYEKVIQFYDSHMRYSGYQSIAGQVHKALSLGKLFMR